MSIRFATSKSSSFSSLQYPGIYEKPVVITKSGRLKSLLFGVTREDTDCSQAHRPSTPYQRFEPPPAYEALYHNSVNSPKRHRNINEKMVLFLSFYFILHYMEYRILKFLKVISRKIFF